VYIGILQWNPPVVVSLAKNRGDGDVERNIGQIKNKEYLFSNKSSTDNNRVNKHGFHMKSGQKSHWTKEDDALLKSLVQSHGANKWSAISKKLDGKYT
jgi:hypothetical protein